MTKKEWQKIRKAANLLGLENQASLAEIKKAYRRHAKKCHPDTAESRPGKDTDSTTSTMTEITEAYQLLIDYCGSFRFPLIPGADESFDAEDWWLDRFGQDPLWGKKSP